ncbi:hypothetical protein [Streptomyces sp. NPDC046197]|uniref:hypothetical protein n=1 Tax=Streptomyces sp. NPDC046197 TaxID=3154337 RepID=UPI0034024690
MRLHYEVFKVTSAVGRQLFVYSAQPGTPGADALMLLRSLAGDTLTDYPRHRRRGAHPAH